MESMKQMKVLRPQRVLISEYLIRFKRLLTEAPVEARHLGLEGGGVEGFADGGVEGVAVEEGLEGGGDGVQFLLRADFTRGHGIGENLLPEGDFVLHNLVIAFAKVRIVALDLQDKEKVGVGGISG